MGIIECEVKSVFREEGVCSVEFKIWDSKLANLQ